MALPNLYCAVSSSPDGSSTDFDPVDGVDVAPGAKSSPVARSRHLPAFSLSTLLSLFIVTILAPFLGLAAYSLQALVKDLRTAEIQRVADLAIDLAQALDREIDGHVVTARILTSARPLQRGDIPAFAEMAEDAGRLAEGHFILIDRSHQQLVNTRVALRTPLPETFQWALEDEVFSSGEARVGSFGFGAFAGHLVFSVNVPVQVDGEIPYILTFVPDRQVMRELIEDAYRPEGWHAAVVDGNGVVVARSDGHEEFFSQPASPDVRDVTDGVVGALDTVVLEGNEVITAYGSSAFSGWKSVVWAPKSLLRQSAMAGQTFVALLLLPTLAASILVTCYVARLIREPAMQALAAADALAKGAPVNSESSIMQEANMVGEALSAASRAIHSREATLREAEARSRVVMQEMSHRAKNMLTVIQAIASQSGRAAADFNEFRVCFQQRLAGLARSHDLLLCHGGVDVQLEELIEAYLAAFVELDGVRVRLRGPAQAVGPEAAQHLGMALHELSTNALKHGSLSVPTGQVRVEWDRGADNAGRDLLFLRWTEAGGPSPTAKPTSSFGSILLEQIVPSSLNSSSRLERRPEGLVWEIEIPMEQLN